MLIFAVGEYVSDHRSNPMICLILTVCLRPSIWLFIIHFHLFLSKLAHFTISFSLCATKEPYRHSIVVHKHAFLHKHSNFLARYSQTHTHKCVWTVSLILRGSVLLAVLGGTHPLRGPVRNHSLSGLGRNHPLRGPRRNCSLRGLGRDCPLTLPECPSRGWERLATSVGHRVLLATTQKKHTIGP